MAEVARWTEGPLKPDRYHDSVFPPIEDRELSERIRSLLSLRSRCQSPSALRPSPGFAQSVNESEGLYAGHRPINRQSSTTNASKPIAGLSLKDFQQPFKGTQEPLLETFPYARPAKVSQDNGHRDNQNQPDINQGGTLNRDEVESLEATSTTSPLTPRTPIGPSSRQSRSLTSQPTSDSRSRPMSYPAKTPVRPRLPLYNLKTVPAHTCHQPEAPMNPEILHVPGDYQSETGASTPRGFQTPSELNEALNSSIHAKSLTNSRAVKTFSSVKGYDGSDSTQSSKPSLRTEPSEATLASTNSTLPSGHPPSDVFVGQSQHSKVSEPASTLGSDRWPYPKGLGPSTAEPGDKGSKDILTRLQSFDAYGQEADVDSRDQGTHDRVVNRDFSASMRPEASSQASQFTELLTIDDTTTGTKDAPGRRTTVFYSPSVIEVPPVNSFRKPTGLDGNLEAKSPIPDINKNQSSDAASSTQARRSSSLDSVQKQQIPPDLDDDRRLTEQANAIDDPEPKRNWIRTLLSPRSNTSSSHNQSNLTARPTRQNSSTGTTTQLQISGDGGGLAVPDITKSSKSINGSSDEGIIALQAQKTTASFTKVVHDLETLLKEALSVARQAADLSGNRHGPLVTNSPVTSRGSFQSVDPSENSSVLSGGLDEEEHYTSSPLQYNRDQISTDANNLEPRFVLNKDARPYPGRSVAPTRHQSIVSASELVNICPKRVSSHLAKEINLEYSNTSAVAATDKAAQQDPNDVSSVIGDVQDWAFNTQISHRSKAVPMPQQPEALQTPLKEQNAFIKRENAMTGKLHKKFVIQPRTSSAGLRSTPLRTELRMQQSSKEVGGEDFRGRELRPSGGQYRTITQHSLAGRTERPPFSYPVSPVNSAEGGTPSPRDQAANKEHSSMSKLYTLKNRRHYSIREGNGFSLSRSHRRAPVARDWSTPRKRYVATVSCISTALMGLVIGIYAGEVPAIQYAIQDENHYSILGNVVLFSGLAITTVLFWPLPLLHGRKPYLLAAFALLLPLQFPQALAVGPQQKEHIAIYRIGLLVSRAISGLVMGFASLNFKNTLLDLFGASLQSANPHQETVNKNDVRRHGGGMGIWLGIWTWCSIGSIGTGFLIGAVIISGLSVTWGFWIVIILCAFVLILNVFSPETRRSAYRRSMAEVRNGHDVSRRVARGEIKLHIDSTGPIWWGEELLAGWRLCVRMLKQPGFLVLSFYVAWIYGQVVMVIVVSSCQISLAKLWLIL